MQNRRLAARGIAGAASLQLDGRMTESTPRRKPGQQPKGPRRAMTTRAHPDVARVINARAKANGYSTSDYIAVILATEAGFPQHAPSPDRPKPEDQERLPLTG